MGEKNWQYSKRLENIRKKLNTKKEDLIKGLCNEEEYEAILNNKITDKLLRDRLLSRQGVNPNKFESYLTLREFEKVKTCNLIINYVEKKDYEEAFRLIEWLEAFNDSKVMGQFILTMRAIIARDSGNEKLTAELVKKALEVTVELDEDDTPHELFKRNPVLSMQELNLILEFYITNRPTEVKEVCIEIIKYIRNRYFETAIKAKIYPKVLWYLIENTGEISKDETEQLYRDCHDLYHLIVSTKIGYYVPYLLDGYCKVLDMLIAQNPHTYREQELLEEKKRIKNWSDLLKTSFPDSKIFDKSFLFTYVQYKVYCINDVIRNRRTLFGITRKCLADACGMKESELEQVENREIEMPESKVKLALTLLDTQGEYHCTDYIVDVMEDDVLFDDLFRCRKERDFNRGHEILDQLERQLPECTLNGKVISFFNTMMEFEERKITVRDAYERTRFVLYYEVNEFIQTALKDNAQGYALSYENIFMTHLEKQMLYYTMKFKFNFNAPWDAEWDRFEAITESFPKEDWKSYIRNKGLIAQKRMADLNYDKAREIVNKLIKEDMMHRHIDFLPSHMIMLLQMEGDRMAYAKKEKDIRELLAFMNGKY